MTKPRLIVMSVLPGSGKSTLAEQLAQQLRLPMFSVDPIESAIGKSGITKSFETGLAAYLVAATLADEQLKLGTSVIIDAVNVEEEGKDVWRGLATKHGTELIVLLVTLESSLHKQRLESRVRNLHGFNEVTWDKVEVRRKAFTTWKEPVLELDASRDVETSVEEAVRLIVRCGAKTPRFNYGEEAPRAATRDNPHTSALPLRPATSSCHPLTAYN